MSDENLEISLLDRIRVAEAGMLIAQDRYCEMEAYLHKLIAEAKRMADIIERLERRICALEARSGD